MNDKALLRASCACLLALCSTAAWSAPAQWQPKLLPPENEARAPGEPIRLLLPALPAEVLQNLALELDDVDVTGLVSTGDGRRAVFTPPQPLAYGEHSLRLVEYAADGNIIERGAWTIEIRKTALFREASLQSSITVNGVRRISDDNLTEPAPSRNQVNGGAQFQGALAGEAWRATGYLDLLGNSQRALMPRQKEKVDMGQFLLTAEAGPVIAQAGHHAVGPESLIMQGFQRRGISAGVRSAESGASLTAFAMRTQDVVGFQEGFGVGDSDNRTDGVVLTGRPLADRDALVLSATYLTGEGPDQEGAIGTGIAGDPTVTNGEATSLVADSRLLDRRLRLRGEVARTRFDFDGEGRDTDFDGVIDSDQPVEKSRGHALLVSYTPWHDKLVGGQPLAWQLGVENRRLGTFFRSPANPTGLMDRDLWRGFTNVSWSGLDLQFVTARETDNVDDEPVLPRTETLQHFVAASYTPSLNPAPGPDGAAPALPWYGQPSFNASFLDMDQDVIRAPTGFATGALRASRVTTLGATFGYASWSWAVIHSITKIDDFFDLAPDTRSNTTQLNASFRAGERLSLTPTLQVSKIEENDAPAGFTTKDTDTTTAGIAIGYLFAPDVSANLSYNLNRERATDDSVDVTTEDINANVSWSMVQAQGARPGLTLSLEGAYRDSEDRVTAGAEQSTYQVFLKAAIGWSPGF